MSTPVKPSSPPIGDGATAFSRSDAARVAEATRYVERQYRNSPVRTPREPRGGGSSGGLFRLTGTLSAATTLTNITHADSVPQVFDEATHTLADGTGTQAVYNYHNKTFSSGSVVWAEVGNNSLLWVIDARDCPT